MTIPFQAQTPLESMANLGQAMRKHRLSLREQINNSVTVYNEQGEAIDMDRIVKKHSLSKTQLRTLIGGRAETADRIIAECVEKGLILDPVTVGRGKTSAYTFGEQVNVLNYAGKPFNSIEVSKGNYVKLNPVAIAVANRKGGTGKSTIVQTIAAKLALDLDIMGRVLIVDLDTQGSNISFCRLKGDPHKEIPLTLTDILLSDFEESDYNPTKLHEAEFGFKDMVLNAPYPTHIETLHIMPSLPSDDRIVSLESDEDKTSAIFKKLHRIIEILKEEYDYIIFDTAPSDSFNTWLALDVAQMIVVPFRPDELDYDATAMFLASTPNRLARLPSEGKNLMDYKVLVTDFDTKSMSESRVVTRTNALAAGNMINGQVEHSEAFKYSTENSQFIWDLYSNEVPATQRNKAITSFAPVYNHFKQIVTGIAQTAN